MSAPEVRVRSGTLRGRVASGTRRFLGIPYAAPPVGALRFEPPAPPVPWIGIREANAFGASPPQPIDPLSVRLGLLAEHPQGEDCLSLNVFAPDSEEAAPRPVMVWLHGGAFQTGTAAGPAYDASRLALDRGVVVVTLNYRVGALGFLGAGAPNLGLQDQVAALRWVGDEIAAFGGDPANVTVFGESAGAGSIVALLAMPSARGLFGKAIVQSAAPEGVLSREEAGERATILFAEAGLADGDLDGLRRLDIDTLIAAQSRCQEPGPRQIGMYFAPVVDGDVLPEAPMTAVAKGRAADVRLLIGTTAEEMQLFLLSDAIPDLPDAVLPHVIASRLPGSPARALESAEALLALYDPREFPGKLRFFAIETDASLFVPATEFAAGHAARQPSTWMYRFDWKSPMEGGALGACHALDVPFALGTIDRVAEFAGGGAAAERVAHNVQSVWTAFARHGDPSCEATGEWPAYEAERRATLLLNDPCRLVDAPSEERRRAWVRARRG
ncbi:MAG: carboxylesterase/lipase family protein [Myxococcota bacterium]